MGTGKVLLGTGAVLGTGAAIEAGRGIYHGSKVAKEGMKVAKLKNDPEFRKIVKKGILENIPNNPYISGEQVVDKVKMAEKYMPKFSKIDRAQKFVRIGNGLSNQSRTVLNNMERYTKMGVDKVVEKHPNLSKEAASQINKLPKLAGRVGKFGTAVKNSKALGKYGAMAAAAGGTLYINGRSLQEGSARPTKIK